LIVARDISRAYAQYSLTPRQVSDVSGSMDALKVPNMYGESTGIAQRAHSMSDPKQQRRHCLTAIIKDRKGRVLSIGKNSYTKTHPLQAHYSELVGEPYKVYLHAELDAIIRCRDLGKADSISVFRTTRLGKPADSTPCKICRTAITAAGIKKVFHT